MDASVLQSVLWALPLVLLHLPGKSLESECWLLDCCLQIVSGPKYSLGVRSCAAAAIAGLASGAGEWLTAISGRESFFKACDRVIDKVRDVYSNLPAEAESELKAAGCIQVEAFMGALIDDSNHNEGTGDILKIICTDLVTTAVQNLADGNFRKSCGAYGALDFVAAARGLSIEALLSLSNCREDVTVHMIRCMVAGEGVGEGQAADVRMIRAYVSLFGDGSGKGKLGDEDECCKVFLDTVFKEVAHRLLSEDDGRLIDCIGQYINMEPGEMLCLAAHNIITNLFFANARGGNEAKVQKAQEMLKHHIGMDAAEAARELPICYDHLLKEVLL